ncbi:MAG: heme-binding domain-containing protein [Longimicrobiales bacterium]
MNKRHWQYGLAGLVLLFLILQLVPAAAADNPPVEEEVTAPTEVLQILRQSCYDCHSHETAWPWYASVAPSKWLVRSHVEDARSDLNFSTWNHYDADEAAHKWEEVAEEVEEEHMPLRSYRIIHRDARLTDADRERLVEWAARQADAGEEAAEAGAEEEAGPAEGPDR